MENIPLERKLSQIIITQFIFSIFLTSRLILSSEKTFLIFPSFFDRSSLVPGGKSSSLGGLSSPAPSSLMSNHGVFQANHHHHHQQQQQQHQQQQQQQQQRQQSGGAHLLPYLERPGNQHNLALPNII